MLRLLADENFNRDLVRGLLRRRSDMDIVRVQDVGLSGTSDPEVLDWAAREHRITLTHDVTTMTDFAAARLKRRQLLAGVFLVHQRRALLSAVIDDLLLLDDCSETVEWNNQVIYLPLR
jgi:uncharacterized protein DUF5615